MAATKNLQKSLKKEITNSRGLRNAEYIQCIFGYVYQPWKYDSDAYQALINLFEEFWEKSKNIYNKEKHYGDSEYRTYQSVAKKASWFFKRYDVDDTPIKEFEKMLEIWRNTLGKKPKKAEIRKIVAKINGILLELQKKVKAEGTEFSG